MSYIERWKLRVSQVKTETFALYLAYRDPRVPWYAKAFAACVVAYALSPIDLIPDFIPILGYLDDVILVPLGVTLAVKMIPEPVLEQCREKARECLDRNRPANWLGLGIVLVIWLILAALAVLIIVRAIVP